jgi:hypothetical protein
MNLIAALIYLTSAYPLARAWRANRATTLVHALNWTVAAWLAWWCAVLLGDEEGTVAIRYLALCLTGCAGIAVMGARRPIVGAWNCVLLALLGVLLLPLAEHAVLGIRLLDPLRLVFVIGTIAVAVLNYLPTRLAWPALLVGGAGALEVMALSASLDDSSRRSVAMQIANYLWPLACWLALLAQRRDWRGTAVFDRDWLGFRDRYGLMWSQRIREQFNRAAANASWPVNLYWRGLRMTVRDAVIPGAVQETIVTTFREMLKRFGPVES